MQAVRNDTTRTNEGPNGRGRLVSVRVFFLRKRQIEVSFREGFLAHPFLLTPRKMSLIFDDTL